jgi:YesN/AraC family two-component response regulator
MKKVFIVDDEIYCIRLIENLIKKFHIPMEICGSTGTGEQAVEMIKTLQPNLIFMDIEMPGLNGLDAIRMIKAQTEIKAQFVIISAYDNFRYAQDALRLGVTDFLLKPIDSQEFVDMIQRTSGYTLTSNISFNQLLAYVHDYFREELELKQCSEIFHMSPNHITRLFKKYIGLGFTEYKNKLRIDFAIRLFDETDKSIKEVCQEVGFLNMNYFYKLFKEATGKTPKYYKESLHSFVDKIACEP